MVWEDRAEATSPPPHSASQLGFGSRNFQQGNRVAELQNEGLKKGVLLLTFYQGDVEIRVAGSLREGQADVVGGGREGLLLFLGF